jgi:hypothetical protein
MRTYMTRNDASRHLQQTYGLRCSPQTLAKYASIGGGPVFRKAAAQAIYTEADLNAWAEARISGPRASTSTPAEHSAAA